MALSPLMTLLTATVLSFAMCRDEKSSFDEIALVQIHSLDPVEDSDEQQLDDEEEFFDDDAAAFLPLVEQNTAAFQCVNGSDEVNGACSAQIDFSVMRGNFNDSSIVWYTKQIAGVDFVHATFEDFQRVWFCMRTKVFQPACAAPPCECSRPPCFMCPIKRHTAKKPRAAPQNNSVIQASRIEATRQRNLQRKHGLREAAASDEKRLRRIERDALLRKFNANKHRQN
uniref:Uncharacterized protein n=1 Tax=Alexandrium catenella TaxID=2925 RepID=A0A7S1RWW9_ALECA|mmetsp:Transcript_7684/g.20858  ORF Transcript_7684/g.20858 Transcript_7684/m.20858 type:complete len:227 (+) Transcript_7684:57-737(+)|eukprot:CAMPEP_0171240144 /NCGR_PEP_ID=MMETSP0790-20130122/44340_1 /TAXON_ID=2925 /ORGANISM="Alexandrium catenella, Strain OF101" /LENGTH=226 /DNA_ID=CAMNT_0011706537 /DNA_START=57 /DNA_END=737 /DNA_ORIENTATION=-